MAEASVAEVLTALSASNTDEFLQSWESWYDQLWQVVSGRDAERRQSDRAWLVLGALLLESAAFGAAAHDVATTRVPKIYAVICDGDAPSAAALRCLAVCLDSFGGAATSARERVDQLVMRSLASSSAAVRTAATACFALTPRIGAPGERSARHAQAWLRSFDAALQSTVVAVRVVDEAVIVDEAADCLQLANVDSTDLNAWCARVDTLYGCLTALLLDSGLAAAPMVPLGRALRVSQTSLVKDPKCVASGGPELLRVHSAALKFSKLLFERFGPLLIPLARETASFLLDELRWAVDLPKSAEATALQCDIYGALTAVANGNALAARLHEMCDRLVEPLLGHLAVGSAVRVVQHFNADVQTGQRKRKRKSTGSEQLKKIRQAGDRLVVKASYSGSAAPTGSVLVECCHFLESFVLSAGSFLNTAMLSTVQLRVCKLAWRFATGDAEECVERSNDEMRAVLSLLQALLLARCNGVAPPVQIASEVFGATLQQRISDALRADCHRGLAMCAALARPLVPPSAVQGGIDNAPGDAEVESSRGERVAADDSGSVADQPAAPPSPAALGGKEPVVVDIGSESSDEALSDAEPVPPPQLLLNGSTPSSLPPNTSIDRNAADGPATSTQTSAAVNDGTELSVEAMLGDLVT